MKKRIVWEPVNDASKTVETYRTFREGEVIGEGFCSGGRFQYVLRKGRKVKVQPNQERKTKP